MSDRIQPDSIKVGWIEPGTIKTNKDELECNGICLTAADIGLPEYSRDGEVAYAHPECEKHGDEEMRMHPPIMDEEQFFHETGRLFEPGETERPEDADQAEASYRIKIKGCDHDNFVEMTLDTPELEFLRRFEASATLSADGFACKPTIQIAVRVKPGDIDDDDNFVIDAQIVEG